MLSAISNIYKDINYFYKKGLVKMQGEKITLQNIKGIGDKISEKIINSVGGEKELQKIVDEVDA